MQWKLAVGAGYISLINRSSRDSFKTGYEASNTSCYASSFWFEKSLCARRETGLKASKAKVSVSCCIELSAKDLGAQAVIATSTEKISKNSCSFADIGLESEKKYNQSDMRSSSGGGAPCRPHRLSNSAWITVRILWLGCIHMTWHERFEQTGLKKRQKRFGLQHRVALLKRCLPGWR